MIIDDEHFFRHEYANLVATLSRKIGVQHLELIEDAVQTSLLKAMEVWRTDQPEKPQAWLYRVAYNHLIDELRKRQPLDSLEEPELLSALDSFQVSNITDLDKEHDLLHMLFICCDPEIPEKSRWVIALKVICGFSIKEIALRLFISEANVHKRYQRARDLLRTKSAYFNSLPIEKSSVRLASVLCVLYMLFNESYLSYSQDESIRLDLCEETIRLLKIIAKTTIGNNTEVMALLALMTFNLARMNSRRLDNGDLLLLEEQQRSCWNQALIAEGFEYLTSSAEGDHLSRYHLEAAIAAEHCRAPSFEKTDWKAIFLYYQQLENLFTSYHYRLNRAVALAEWKGPQAGLNLLFEVEPPTWMTESYLWLTVAADLYARSFNKDKAKHYAELAIQCAPNESIKNLISRRLNKYFI